MNQPQLNPDAPDSQVSVDQRVEVIETPARDYPSHGAVTISLHYSERQSTTIQIAERTAESLRDQLNDLLATAQPEVASVEELEALPHETVIRDNKDFVFEKIVHHDKSSEWWSTTDFLCDDLNVSLPARVLYLPEVKP